MPPTCRFFADYAASHFSHYAAARLSLSIIDGCSAYYAHADFSSFAAAAAADADSARLSLIILLLRCRLFFGYCHYFHRSLIRQRFSCRCPADD